MTLTGQVRHRTEAIKRLFGPPRLLLVLQVEYHNHDSDFSPSLTLWRDAQSEDFEMLMQRWQELEAQQRTTT